MNDFKVDIYDYEGNLLCEDYRKDTEPFVRRGGGWEVAAAEGHKLEAKVINVKYKLLKKWRKDMFFYGFGEKTGHLNKKGYHYKMWNTDNPNPHVESFEALYKSIPFFITIKGKESFWYISLIIPLNHILIWEKKIVIIIILEL